MDNYAERTQSGPVGARIRCVRRERSDDWCFDVDKKGVIERVRVGGDSGVWQMVGISYWSPEDGHKLVGDIEKTIGMPGARSATGTRCR